MVLHVRCGGLSQAHISRHLGIRLFGQGTSPGCDASYLSHLATAIEFPLFVEDWGFVPIWWRLLRQHRRRR